MELSAPSLGLAFLAGLASFLSPCVFALVPAYVSYLGGRSAATPAKRDESATRSTFSHGLAFVLGFSVVFITLGLISSTIGALLFRSQWVLSRVGGVVAILLGLHLARVIRIPFLDFDLRPQNKVQRQRSYLSSALMGVFFSAGWSPCIGPALGIILTLAANGGSPVQGSLLLSAYSAGLAIPFLLAATQIGWVTYLIRKHSKLGLTVERVMGVLLTLVGVLLFTGRLATLGSLGVFFEIGSETQVGGLLLLGILVSLGIGLLVAWWSARRGKIFMDWLFLGAGLSLLVLTVLFLFGAFPFLA